MIELKEVLVKDVVFPIDSIKYKVESTHKLKLNCNPVSNVFSEVIESRKSRRQFSDISLDHLGSLFYSSSRTKESMINDYGLKIEKRNTPSCGAMHTIDCIVSQFGREDWYVYNPHNHAFDKLMIDFSIANSFKSKCHEIVGYPDAGYLIWYVCDIERLNSKYEHAEYLALRESGALAATQGLIAESYGLAFCMLGLMGNEEVKGLSDQRDLLGVGTAIVGGLVASV